MNHDWAVVGPGVWFADARQRKELLKQDCLSTIIALDLAGSSAEICGSMLDYVSVEEGKSALIRLMADPAISIVSLTVTKDGYNSAPETVRFDCDNPDFSEPFENQLKRIYSDGVEAAIQSYLEAA